MVLLTNASYCLQIYKTTQETVGKVSEQVSKTDAYKTVTKVAYL